MAKPAPSQVSALPNSAQPIAPFQFATATRILFGAGTIRQLGPLAAQLGRHALLVTGRNANRAAPLIPLLQEHHVDCLSFCVPGEPDLATIDQGTQLARSEKCDLVISLGGGSALDSGKAIAALLTNQGDALDYLEVVGRGKSIANPSLPFVAIPTTAGTGSEVTRNAVIASLEHRTKASLRSPHMQARIAIVDPELTYGLPPALTAATGMDALTQLIEPFVSCRANPLIDPLCLDGIARVARSLPVAFGQGANPAAREDMALASLFGGLALANAGLGAVHGFAGPIGGMFDAPHGAVCAALLPHVITANINALRTRQPQHQALGRYQQIATLLTADAAAPPEAAAASITQLVQQLQIPSLRTYGLAAADIPEIVERACEASSMKANPLPLTRNELAEILHHAL